MTPRQSTFGLGPPQKKNVQKRPVDDVSNLEAQGQGGDDKKYGKRALVHRLNQERQGYPRREYSLYLCSRAFAKDKFYPMDLRDELRGSSGDESDDPKAMSAADIRSRVQAKLVRAGVPTDAAPVETGLEASPFGRRSLVLPHK
ncbi:hypothetical protein B0T26DRAFT_676823 [Lasiosphaeria miniovina]|uniref:Uncharacterized protein n=1 Tax=Lasiosphaeria miniovina TaxID=1954250 RepID=A0AA40AB31_9PEZI|nr:uncharacterized protein B0T26DRAFT_676823 [Lasiosphaeria miniovina]KAK0712348.1 hypothetical protein B0T26DRAFT_676823 [Lasiosphaeria miniovina]